MAPNLKTALMNFSKTVIFNIETGDGGSGAASKDVC
jgi:hypothetical protein